MNDYHLEFGDQFTIGEFLQEKGSEDFYVYPSKQNPGTLYFSWAPEGVIDINRMGKVTTNELTKPVISECTDTESGETFYMLHNVAEAPKPVMRYNLKTQKLVKA